MSRALEQLDRQIALLRHQQAAAEMDREDRALAVENDPNNPTLREQLDEVVAEIADRAKLIDDKVAARAALARRSAADAAAEVEAKRAAGRKRMLAAVASRQKRAPRFDDLVDKLVAEIEGAIADGAEVLAGAREAGIDLRRIENLVDLRAFGVRLAQALCSRDLQLHLMFCETLIHPRFDASAAEQMATTTGKMEQLAAESAGAPGK